MSRHKHLGLAIFGGALALFAAALAAAPVGCTVLTNDAPRDDAGVYEGGTDGATVACGSCVEQACVGPWAVCLTDERCRSIRACSSKTDCGPSCRDACSCAAGIGLQNVGDAGDAGDASATDPVAAYRAFTSCNDARTCTTCASDCASTCSGGAPSTTPNACGSDAGSDAGAAGDAGDAGDAAGDAGDASADASSAPKSTPTGCASCVDDACEDGKKACAVGTECAAYLGCVHACADAACVSQCRQAHATGEVEAVALATCTRTACSAACGL